MDCDYYEILIDDVVIASRVTLEWALPIVKAVFEHLYNETDLAVTVRKMEALDRSGLLHGDLLRVQRSRLRNEILPELRCRDGGEQWLSTLRKSRTWRRSTTTARSASAP